MRDALDSVDSVLVLGGGSEIALATVRALPGPLRFVFSALRHLPRPLFRRLDL